MSAIDKLDIENSSRIEEIARSFQDDKDLLLSDIFHSTPVIPSITQSKILLPSFDLATIYANYPFAERVYVIVCPRCVKPEETKLLRELLAHSDVVPVMIAPYAAYPSQVVRTVLEFPHINQHEFYFYRSVRVQSLGQKIVCGHCVEVREREIVENAKQFSPAAVEQVRNCIGNLHPFIDPDFELITTLADTVKRNDSAALIAILGTTEMINEIRTCQAYDSRSLLPIREVPNLVKTPAHFFRQLNQKIWSKSHLLWIRRSQSMCAPT